MPQILGRTTLLAILLLALWPTAVMAQSAAACPPGRAPSFLSGFASLQTNLGSSMGEPTECEHVDPVSGDTFQRTTTGLALYRRDTNTPMFTNGREHWALTSDGLVHWSGWHGSAAPREVAAPRLVDEAQTPGDAPGTYTHVDAVTIVEVLDDEYVRLVVQRDDVRLLITTDGSCATQRTSTGDIAFVVSPDAFAAPGSRLILTLGGGECLIVEAHPG
jgi:hypothetical protein